MDRPVTIAIDGPSGSGKSSTARGVATELALAYVDTGAMYRAVTWWMLTHGVDVDDAEAVAAQASLPVIEVTTDPAAPVVFLDGVDVGHAIRTPEVTAAVSRVSAVPRVRQSLVARQRQIVADLAQRGLGVVMEGRDIGTVVLPEADAKVFLTADPRARAQRRAMEDAQRGTAVAGDATTSVSATHDSLLARDALDSTRTVSPLLPADDALLLDGTDLTLAEVIAAVISFVRVIALENREDDTP